MLYCSPHYLKGLTSVDLPSHMLRCYRFYIYYATGTQFLVRAQLAHTDFGEICLKVQGLKLGSNKDRSSHTGRHQLVQVGNAGGEAMPSDLCK